MRVETPSLVGDLGASPTGAEVDLSALVDQIEARFGEVEDVVQAFVDEPNRFQRLRRDAEVLAERWPDLEHRPPLFGVAVGIKDVFHVDGLPTRAGSLLPAKVLAGAEADCVTALREVGVLIVGKTVTTEFAYFAPGPTRNPHDPARTPGGSSSGSAAAVAAGLASFAIGTQTIGSITRPASFCGVVGYKPSYGRISVGGMIALAPSFDHVGVLAADVATAQRVAEVLVDGWAPTTLDRRPRLGVLGGAYLDQASESARRGFRNAVERLSAAAWEVTEEPGFESMTAVDAVHGAIVAAEAAEVHAQWSEDFAALYHPRTNTLIEEGWRRQRGDLDHRRAERVSIAESAAGWTESRRIDLWISPSAPGPAPEGLGSTGDPCMNRLWTQLGVPTLGVPIAGGIDGLPFGLQIAAKVGEDERLFAWAEEIAECVGRHEQGAS